MRFLSLCIANCDASMHLLRAMNNPRVPFTKFVEIGRICFIAFGPDAGKICAIVDVIDQNKALIEGPCSKVKRRSCNFKRLHLTKFKIRIPHSTSSKVVKKQWEKDDISKQWNETSWAKKVALKKLRAKMTDFDKFKVYKARQAFNREVKREFFKLRGAEKKHAKASK